VRLAAVVKAVDSELSGLVSHLDLLNALDITNAQLERRCGHGA
jgi:hypothetical protein